MQNTLLTPFRRLASQATRPAVGGLIKLHNCSNNRRNVSSVIGALFVKDSDQTTSKLQTTIKRKTSSSSALPSPVYELRNYRYEFSEFKKTIELFEQNMHLRTNHSELIGFWMAEIGRSIHEVVHIWKYDSLSHRKSVRQALGGDQEWQTSFMVPMVKGLHYMNNSLITPVPGTQLNLNINKEPGSGAVYTLQQVPKSTQAPSQGSDDQCLIGRFNGILGDTNVEYRLWRYADIDAATAGAYKQAMEISGDSSNVLLYPTSFSPLQ